MENMSINAILKNYYLGEKLDSLQLDPGELYGLFKKIEITNDEELKKKYKEKILLGNIKLVPAVIFRFILRSSKNSIIEKSILSYEDIIQEGLLGLYLAIDRYKLNLNERFYSFSTFAVPYIYGMIQKLIFERFNAIRIPRNLFYNKKEDENIQRKFSTLSNIVSLDRLVNADNEDSIEFHEFKTTPEELRKNIGNEIETKMELEYIINNLLKENERLIFKLYFLEDMTQSEISEICKISQSYISRILKRIKYKLKTYKKREDILYERI